MAFGTRYGYKTNVGSVVAFAEGDEYVDDTVTKVDLVLTGMSSGGARRAGVPVAASAAAAVTNEAFNAEADADVVA